jgi:hypothetical protein
MRKTWIVVAGLTMALTAPVLANGYDGYDTHIVTNTPNNPTNNGGVQSGYYAALDARQDRFDRYERRGYYERRYDDSGRYRYDDRYGPEDR